MNTRLVKLAAVGAALVALALGGAAWAVAGGGDGEGNATGPDADRAKAAAIAQLGGGKVNAVERDSEKGATWEVEVTKTSGDTVDVRLDASYGVVAVDTDSETADEGGSGGEVDTDSETADEGGSGGDDAAGDR